MVAAERKQLKWPESSSQQVMLLDASVFAEHFFMGPTVVRVNTQGVTITGEAVNPEFHCLTAVSSANLQTMRVAVYVRNVPLVQLERFGSGVVISWISSPARIPSSGRGWIVGECPLLLCRLLSCLLQMISTQLLTSLALQ